MQYRNNPKQTFMGKRLFHAQKQKKKNAWSQFPRLCLFRCAKSPSDGNKMRVNKKKSKPPRTPFLVPRNKRPTKLHPRHSDIASRPRTFPAARRRISVVAAWRTYWSPDSSILVAPVLLRSIPYCPRFRFRSVRYLPAHRDAVVRTHRPMAPAVRADRSTLRFRITAVGAAPTAGLDFGAIPHPIRYCFCCCCCYSRR